jgi:hypothetical protein
MGQNLSNTLYSLFPEGGPRWGQHHRVWVPAGNTGSVDVVDTTSEKITRVEGFPTAEFERGGTKRTVGPSAAKRDRGGWRSTPGAAS